MVKGIAAEVSDDLHRTTRSGKGCHNTDYRRRLGSLRFSDIMAGGLARLRQVVRLALTTGRCSSKLHTTGIILQQEVGGSGSRSARQQEMFRPSKVLTKDFVKEIEGVDISKCTPSSSIEENRRSKLQYTDMEQPKENLMTFKNIVVPSRHVANLEKLSKEVLALAGTEFKWKVFEEKKNIMVENRLTGKTMEIDHQHMVIHWLLQACKHTRSRQNYFSILYLLEGVECKFTIGILVDFLECMAMCGWLDLVKRNARKVLDNSSEFNLTLLVTLSQIYVENGDLEFAMELMANFRKIMVKRSLDLEAESYHKKLLALLSEVVRGDKKEEERRHALVKDILDIYQVDDSVQGWSQARAEAIVEVLQKTSGYRIRSSSIQSDGTCLSCQTKLVAKSIPGLDHARLRMSLYQAIMDLEKKHRSSRGYQCHGLLKMMRNKDYGIVIDGLNVSRSFLEKSTTNASNVISVIRKLTDRRKLVILRSHKLRNNEFSHLDDFDIFFVDGKVDDDLYLLCGGLFGSHDVLVLTNDHLRDKRDILDSHSHDILSQWKETRVVQLEGRKKQQYIIKKPAGVKVPSTAEAKKDHCHLLYRNDSESLCFCIQKRYLTA